MNLQYFTENNYKIGLKKLLCIEIAKFPYMYMWGVVALQQLHLLSELLMHLLTCQFKFFSWENTSQKRDKCGKFFSMELQFWHNDCLLFEFPC